MLIIYKHTSNQEVSLGAPEKVTGLVNNQGASWRQWYLKGECGRGVGVGNRKDPPRHEGTASKHPRI